MKTVPGPRRRLVLLGVGFLVLVAGAIWTVARYRHTGRAGFDDAVARLRADGYATTLTEWAGVPVPDADNAAVEIVAADRWLLATFGGPESWKGLGPWRTDRDERWWEGATHDEIAESRAFLESSRPYFELLERAAARQHLQWFVRVDESGWSASDGVPFLQRFAKLASSRTRLAESSDDRLAAIDARLRIAQFPDRRLLVDEMVALAIAADAATDLADAVTSGEIPATTARRAVGASLRPFALPRLPAVVRAEIAAITEFLTAMYDGRAQSAGEPILPRTESGAGRLVRLYFGGPGDLLDVLGAVAAVRATTYRDFRERYRAIAERAGTFPRTAAVVWPQLAAKAAGTDARLGLAAIALAVAERHENTGAWPASLDDVRGEFPDGIPLDPFTDAPFVYEVTDDNVRIASVGRLPQDESVDDATLRERGHLWEFPK